MTTHIDPSWLIDVDASEILRPTTEVGWWLKSTLYVNNGRCSLPTSTGELIPDFWLPSTEWYVAAIYTLIRS